MSTVIVRTVRSAWIVELSRANFSVFNRIYGSGATGQQNRVFESVQCGRV